MKRSKHIKKIVKKEEKKHPFRILYFLFSILIVGCVIALFGKSTNDFHYKFKANYNEIQKENSEYNRKNKIKIALLGNSVVRDGFDQKLFIEITGIPIRKTSPGGVASAYWYLYIKNQITGISYKGIELIVIVFRDYELTNPFHGVNDYYIEELSRINTDKEPVLERLSYQNKMSNLEYFIYKNFRIYQDKFIIKEKFNNSVKEGLEKYVFDIGINESDSAINRVFSIEKMNQKLQTEFELKEKTLKLGSFSDIGNSYLPEILKLAKQNKLQLLFVRYKKRRDLVENAQPENLIEYNKKLNKYFYENDIPIIDLTNSLLIKEEHYRNGDHLNSEGRKVFTKLLTDSIKKKYKVLTPEKVLLNQKRD